MLGVVIFPWEEYEEIIKILFLLFEDKPIIKVKDILENSKLNQFNEESKGMALQYLIKEGVLKLRNINLPFKKNELQVRPQLEQIKMPVLKKLSFFLKCLCLSFPIYDIYGLKEHFKEKQIYYSLLKSEIKRLFDSANSTIRICSPFLEYNGLAVFSEQLISKATQGVNIKILTRELFQNKKRKRIIGLFKAIEDEKVLSRIIIKDYHYSIKNTRVTSSIHAKFIISDNIEAYIGSGEIRRNSFNKNFELGIVISGSGVQHLIDIFEAIFSRGRDITLC